MADTLEICSCPTCITTLNFVALRQTFLGAIMEIRQKMLTLCVPLFKVTEGHWNRHWSIGCPISVP